MDLKHISLNEIIEKNKSVKFLMDVVAEIFAAIVATWRWIITIIMTVHVVVHG